MTSSLWGSHFGVNSIGLASAQHRVTRPAAGAIRSLVPSAGTHDAEVTLPGEPARGGGEGDPTSSVYSGTTPGREIVSFVTDGTGVSTPRW